MTGQRVVVAMSGGVDSSIAAALLVEQGYDVTGMMMRLWSEAGSENDNRCCTPDAMALARRVAAKLNIPFYVVDAQEKFRDIVVEYFIRGYSDGETPNPCLVCNRSIRWDFLLKQAIAIGADFMATGHYVRLVKGSTNRFQLSKAVDANKDQSYVLHVLNQEQLARALFPLGDLTKPEVREMARNLNLPVANRPESQDLCFLGNEDYRSFLERNVPGLQTPGPILNQAGLPLGEHRGLAFYTIGQRKGLNISTSTPLYVIEKNINQNTLIVGSKNETTRNELLAKNVTWISGSAPTVHFNAKIKIRYKSPEVLADCVPLENQRVKVKFTAPVHDITPGQAAVFYDDDFCLGGGIIE